jgi:hypothetical protein
MDETIDTSNNNSDSLYYTDEELIIIFGIIGISIIYVSILFICLHKHHQNQYNPIVLYNSI